jgi:hypothetical protein
MSWGVLARTRLGMLAVRRRVGVVILAAGGGAVRLVVLALGRGIRFAAVAAGGGALLRTRV